MDIVPGHLVFDLKERYRTLGEKYATDEIHEESGLRINSCMQRDNLQECYEEIVDAVFNVLVFIYRAPDSLKGVGHQIYEALLAADAIIGSEMRRDYDASVSG